MKKNLNQRKKVARVLVAIAVLIIVVTGVIAFNMINGKNDNLDDVARGNFVASESGNKINISTKVTEDKKVEGVVISKSRLVYENGMSKLTSQVTNNAEDIDNLRFKVKFIANDNSIIAESVGYVGEIKKGQTKFIESGITFDVINAKDIVYEIIK